MDAILAVAVAVAVAVAAVSGSGVAVIAKQEVVMRRRHQWCMWKYQKVSSPVLGTL